MTDKHWPKALVAALPKLLTKLIALDSCQSLERLQLIGLNIHLLDKKAASEPEILDTSLKKEGNKLQLFGKLKGPKAEITINYFMRGARKFHRVEPKIIDDLKEKPIEISMGDVADFFKNIGQENNFFYDQALSELNGINRPVIPTLVLIDLLLQQTKDVLGQNYSFDFIFAPKIEQSLKIASGQSDQGFYYALLADGEKALELLVA